MQIERRTLRGSTRADRVRNRLAHSLSFETAKAAGWNYTDLTLFFSGGYYPSERALDALVNGARNLPTCGGPIFPTWAGMVISPRCDRGSRS